MVKVLFASSSGGHLEQLKIIINNTDVDKIFVATTTEQTGIKRRHTHILISDFNATKPFAFIPALLEAIKMIKYHSPDVVIATGAAPALPICLAATLFRKKTIWIDSVANISKISLSGKIAILFVDDFIVQWPHLADSKKRFKGSLL